MTPLSNFIAIDPGFAKANGTGWCIVASGQLFLLGLAMADDHDATLAVRCEQIRGKVPTILHAYPNNILLPRVIEHMKVYPGPQQKGDQNDLISLGYLEGVLAAGAPSVELTEARAWKGNAPKEIVQARIVKRLKERGLERLLDNLPKAKEKRGSVLEAAGIALHRLGGLGR